MIRIDEVQDAVDVLVARLLQHALGGREHGRSEVLRRTGRDWARRDAGEAFETVLEAFGGSHVGIRRAVGCAGRGTDLGLHRADVREPNDGHPVDLLLRIDRQVGDRCNTAQRLDREHGPPVPDVGEWCDARQSLAPVDANRAGPARSVMAGVAEDERWIRFGPGPLDHVEDRVGRPLHGYLDLLVPGPAPTDPGRPPQPQSKSVRHRSTAGTSGAEPRWSDRPL